MMLANAAHSSTQAPSSDDVHAAIEEIFTRPEFQAKKSPWDTWLSEIVDAIGRWLAGTGIDAERAGQVAAALVYGILIAVALAVLVYVSRALWRVWTARKRAMGEPAAPAHAGKLVARALCGQAREAYERGDHRSAVRFYFRALVIGLSEHGHLVYRESWTNRELIHRGAPPRNLEPILQALLPRLDALSFGHVAAKPADVEQWATLVRRHLPGVHA